MIFKSRLYRTLKNKPEILSAIKARVKFFNTSSFPIIRFSNKLFKVQVTQGIQSPSFPKCPKPKSPKAQVTQITSHPKHKSPNAHVTQCTRLKFHKLLPQVENMYGSPNIESPEIAKNISGKSKFPKMPKVPKAQVPQSPSHTKP